MNEEVFVEGYEKGYFVKSSVCPHIFRKYGIKKEESEERDENPFYKFIWAIFEKCCPDGTKRYYECRS
ncbi:MAG: hypothetical protein HXP01_06225 [Streptococcus sp.]|uniref:hypothetical protein n=1 Tax=Streptococcus TaxID=1301 RepID=UPI001CAFF0FF|nr:MULTISPECIES: hypothetical protein [Streptococcus]MBF1739035.1 hypothetical protein [Streptococcus sp.]